MSMNMEIGDYVLTNAVIGNWVNCYQITNLPLTDKRRVVVETDTHIRTINKKDVLTLIKQGDIDDWRYEGWGTGQEFTNDKTGEVLTCNTN